MKKISIGISIVAALLLGARAQADMITVGGDQTAGTGTLTINQDITFEITAPVENAHLIFVFDEVVGADSERTWVSFLGLGFSVNGGEMLGLSQWCDNLDAPQGDMTSNDGFIHGQATSVEIGDVVTLHAGTGTMTSSDAAFNPWSSGDYSMFITNVDARISENGVVPEPATAGMLAVSGLLIAAYRRYFGRV